MAEDILIALGGALLIFALRVAGVGLVTVRILLVTRGVESWSVVLGFLEALMYVVAIGLVVENLTNVPNLLAYCVGFSGGTLVGMRVERRMAIGYVTVHAFSRPYGSEIAQALREAGFGATVTPGEGRSGSVAVVISVVPRGEAGRVGEVVRSVDPEAFVSYDETLGVTRGWMRRVRSEA